ncbi:MAG: excinuclease ABC subunit UvrC [Lachnospiraceae bacterium]|nr:excinuclease ABC subunit UvrC [Lachnospiraceae bacterium]
MDFDFEKELKKLPTSPGVYIMHDEKDEIIYVGKAINLKNRVRQYFRPGADGRIKIEKMMPHVSRFEYIVTDSELEALVLENNLIKEYSPKYNTCLKDGKTYPFICVTLEDEFPRLLFSRRVKKGKSKYFGPFIGSAQVRDTIDLLERLYHIRNCDKPIREGKTYERACLYKEMRMCDAPCIGGIDKETYMKNVEKVIGFLNGDYKDVLNDLKSKMEKEASEMKFEEAAYYRDLMEAVRTVTERQKINNLDGEDRDIVAIAVEDRDCVAQVFMVRDGKLIGREHVYINVAEDEEKSDILNSFISQYYSGTPFLPKEIVTVEEPYGSEELENWLTNKKGSKVIILTPKQGKHKRLVDMAAKNAALLLKKNKEEIKRQEAKTIGAMRELATLLDLPGLKRVEAFDISNTSGFLSVGSMVVFEDGKPKKNDYRKFRLKTVEGPNDYASMNEVLTRRFMHGIEEKEELKESSFTRFPDCIFMDGGKGQVHIAEEVLRNLGLDIPVAGMVKDDNHRTRGIYYKDVELPINTSSEGFKLLTRIQDEAHRFAIEYHKSLRTKNQVHSILDDIPGVGEKRRLALLKAYTSVEEIKNASIEELSKIEGFNKKAAEAVYNFFNSENDA